MNAPSTVQEFIERLRSLPIGMPIPKPKGSEEFKIKRWTISRSGPGEDALVYTIPSRQAGKKPSTKNIRISEWKAAFERLQVNGKITTKWVNERIPRCASGGCTFTTIGGILCKLKLAEYERPGVYARRTQS
jgi:hypothetical protein